MAKKFDLDEVFSYDTFKIVRVKDRRLGLLFRSFQLAIFAYILFTIFKNSTYLKKEPPVPGAIRITLEAPKQAPTTPPYCAGEIPCVYWGANEIQYPSDGAGFAFFTTRATVTNYPQPQTGGGCTFLSASSPDSPCFFNPKTTPGNIIVPRSYIANIEDYTIMIEHSIRGKVTDISLRNGLMDGKLKSYKDEDVDSFNNSTRTETNGKANGDIFTLKEILDAAGVDLDGPSFAPGADLGETNRSAGIVIVILIEYKNVKFKRETIKFNYRPQIIDGAEYKAVESIYNTDGSYTIKDRHGIRLVFQQTGEIGEFDFVALLINLVAALALFKVATTLVEILMLKFLPQKKIYERFKFEETHDFGDYRDGVLGDGDAGNNQPKSA